MSQAELRGLKVLPPHGVWVTEAIRCSDSEGKPSALPSIDLAATMSINNKTGSTLRHRSHGPLECDANSLDANSSVLLRR